MAPAHQDPPPPPDDPALATMSADQLAELVFAMDPEVHYQLAQAFDDATGRLQQVLDGIRREARVVHEGLSGESLTAFDDVSHQLGSSVDTVLQTAWNPDYATTLRAAGDALATAQQRFRDLRGQQAEEAAAPPVDGAPAPEVLHAQRAESALQIVLDLGTAYRDIGARFTPLPLLPGGQGWDVPEQSTSALGQTNTLAATSGDQPRFGEGSPGGEGGGTGSGAFFAGGFGAGGSGPGAPDRRRAAVPVAALGFGDSPVVGRSVEVSPEPTVQAAYTCGPAVGGSWAAATAPAHGVVAGAVGLPPAVLGRAPGSAAPAPKRKRAADSDERQRAPEVDPGERPVKVTAEPAIALVAPTLPVTVSAPPVTEPVQAPATLAASAAPVAHAGGGSTIPAISVPAVEPVTLEHGTTLPASAQFGPPPVRPLAAAAPEVALAAPPPGGTSSQTTFNGHSGVPMTPGYGPMNPMGAGIRGPDERDNGRFAEIPMEAEAGVWQSPIGATVLGRPVAAEQKSAPSSGSHSAEQPAEGDQRSEQDKTPLDQARERALQMIGRTSERER
ncbi:WXG100 family type VII secretion target [Actinokineospora pegani]|uniref:WXG100 family type VII secretion target n=1 Tax=Actinokineospora pegani TaxID=2654637 RepID=UPI0012E9EFEB|nr:WXG100 family type VII secretion target [Actinokineospora pegani]